MTLDQPNGSVLEDDGPLSPPLPQPGTSLFGFGSLPEEMDPSDLAETTSEPLDGPGSGSGTGWPSDEPDDPSGSGPTGQPASSADGGPLKPLSRAAMKATASKAVLIATSMLHRAAARTELQRRAGLYLADEDDQELIGDPIASLLHRRAKATGASAINNPDVNDGIQLAMALANYVTKQVTLVTEIRGLEAQHAGQVPAATDGVEA